jgi:hypothetical protein
MNALAQATGADICAATGRVGAANLGGTWALDAFTHRTSGRPPLTSAGTVLYQGIFSLFTVNQWTTIDINISADDLSPGATYYVAVQLGGPTGTIINIIGHFRSHLSGFL